MIRALLLAGSMIAAASAAAANDRVTISSGILDGTGPQGGVRAFKGIPYAAPPVGDLRWKAPQPVASWTGVRPATLFGPRCMQRMVFGDMSFRSNGMSEDCLYLNVWTPAISGRERLPVLVYFFGGGFIAGDGSEPRYDGESMARKGIVSITVNYRLGEFGFLAHPELTSESPHHASGNYGLLDQLAALQWVQKNIAAFGGDPGQVTIAGESAGSFSVSAQMASPLARGLFARAIGESGSLMGPSAPAPLADGEQRGVAFQKLLGAASLAEMRAMTTQQIVDAAGRQGAPRFGTVIDGDFLPRPPAEIYAAGQQAHVPLLAGSNSEENPARAVLGKEEPTPDGFANAVRRLYGEAADAVLKAYESTTSGDVTQAATDLASDRFIAYSTWKWVDLHAKTGASRVFYYYYARPRPPLSAAAGRVIPALAGGVLPATEATAPTVARGAVHSAEIEYAMGNLATNMVFAWTPEDYRVSRVMQDFFVNFIRTGDPNGRGLPEWLAVNGATRGSRMRIDVDSHSEPDTYSNRYHVLDAIASTH